jgi:hypothetical protein
MLNAFAQPVCGARKAARTKCPFRKFLDREIVFRLFGLNIEREVGHGKIRRKIRAPNNTGSDRGPMTARLQMLLARLSFVGSSAI